MSWKKNKKMKAFSEKINPSNYKPKEKFIMDQAMKQNFYYILETWKFTKNMEWSNWDCNLFINSDNRHG